MFFDLDSFRQTVLNDPLVWDIWDAKYRHKDPDGTAHEATVAETRSRVVSAVYVNDPSKEHRDHAEYLIQGGFLVPAGRINAGAGLDRNVTLMNCYLNEIVQDSMVGIQRAIMNAALTMQTGGGIGTDWSTVRPAGAVVKRTGSVSSGCIPFMDQMSAMCETISSAGTRRGAMMGTLRDDHPDLWNENHLETVTLFDGREVLAHPSFISAKRQRGRLTQFNVSVLVSDALMKAIADNAPWDLGFHVPRADGQHVEVYDRPFPYDEEGEGGRKKGEPHPWYVYRRLPARQLWNEIMRSTYTFAEPGVIFIDRVNRNNNLNYCEDIRSTNPCFTGDTKVWTIGGPRRFDELAATGASVPVLTELPDGRLAYRPMTNPRVTQQEAALVEVTFLAKRGRGGRQESITTLRCTPQHEFFTTAGQRRRAAELRPGDRIESAYRTRANQKGYMRVRSTGGDLTMEHHLTAEFDHGRRPSWPSEHGHHLNEIPDSNESGNIQIVSGSKHNSDHMLGDENPMRKWWETASEVERQRYHERMSASTSGERNGMFEKKHQPDTLSKIGASTKKRMSDPVSKERHRQAVVEWNTKRRAAGLPLGRAAGHNHQVVGVRQITTTEDVYCGTVEATGRFFVSLGDEHYEGVLVSNCGEQPLPPHGICNLASVNLAFMIKEPFTPRATLDLSLFQSTVRAGIRFLDNVLDATHYPLAAQKAESMSKRRIGLGVTGLADALAQLGIRYGSKESVKWSTDVALMLQAESYVASALLAEERGPFRLYDKECIMKSTNVSKLPAYALSLVKKHGLRNGVLNTVAPNGTISIYIGNVGSGIEPFFSTASSTRRVRQPDNSFVEYRSLNYGVRLWEAMFPGKDLPAHIVGAMEVTPADHVAVQAAWQRYIDAAISKTVNCSVDMTFEDFSEIYSQAYESGCKGCTTYRPDPAAGRGSVLVEDLPLLAVLSSTIHDLPTQADGKLGAGEKTGHELAPRPEALDGRTYKLKWPQTGENTYVTINNVDGVPFEMFIRSADPLVNEWTDALGRMLTGVLRRGGDVKFIVEQLGQVASARGGAFLHGAYRPSLVAAIAWVVEEEFRRLGVYGGAEKMTVQSVTEATASIQPILEDAMNEVLRGKNHEQCPVCRERSCIRESGCKKCLSCGHEACG